MKRREFIALIGGAAVSPLVARAQPMMPVVGFLSSRSPGESTELVAAFRKGLRQIGFVEGQSAVIAFRWAEGHYERLPTLASDLVDLRVAAIFAAGCDAGKTSGPESSASLAPSYAVTSTTVTVSYAIAGYGNLGPDQPPLYLAAAKMSDGRATGFAYSPGGLAVNRLASHRGTGRAAAQPQPQRPGPVHPRAGPLAGLLPAAADPAVGAVPGSGPQPRGPARPGVAHRATCPARQQARARGGQVPAGEQARGGAVRPPARVRPGQRHRV